MTYDLSQTCLSHTYTWSTTTLMTNIGLTFLETTTIDNSPAGIILFPSPFLLETPGTNLVPATWCIQQRIISSPLFADQTYYLNDPTLTFSVPKFTLDVVCDDESWIY